MNLPPLLINQRLCSLKNTAQVISGNLNTLADGASVRPSARRPPVRRNSASKDCLQNIRELKELGVNVRFEREGIDTVNVSSELITAIYAAFAQKESESISGNMRWSY